MVILATLSYSSTGTWDTREKWAMRTRTVDELYGNLTGVEAQKLHRHGGSKQPRQRGRCLEADVAVLYAHAHKRSTQGRPRGGR